MIVENCLPEIVFQHYVLCFNQMIDIPRETHMYFKNRCPKFILKTWEKGMKLLEYLISVLEFK